MLKTRSRLEWLKAIISLIAVGVLILRIVYPQLNIDSITLGLIVVAILPWMSDLIESAKFPGGWEVRFRDLQAAGEKITARVAPRAEKLEEPNLPRPTFVTIAENDPNLALVGMRIEIERRLREYASQHQLTATGRLTSLLKELAQKQVLPRETIRGLEVLIQAGNEAAHGAVVPPDVAGWAIETGPEVLLALDTQLQTHKPS